MSDYHGLFGLFDSLDATYSSLMRDLELGQSVKLVPMEWLERRGDDLTFNVNRKIFTALDIDPISANGTGVQHIQAVIRAEEHLSIARDIAMRIVNSAGFSPSSFGIGSGGGVGESGEALEIRERRSFVTKSRKEASWRTPLEDILYLALQVDAKVLGAKVVPFRPRVLFSDNIQPDLEKTGRTLAMLNTAQAVSIRTKVALLNPGWTQKEIDAEADAIMRESGLLVPDPVITIGD